MADYGGRTRISRRYMRALTQTNARGYSRARVCANVPNANDAASISRGLTRRSGRAGAAPDEDNANLPLSYEPGPAIINSSKHSFSYTQLYVVLSPTKRSPPMSFSMAAMDPNSRGPSVNSMGALSRNLRVHRQPCTSLVDDVPFHGEIVSKENDLQACP